MFFKKARGKEFKMIWSVDKGLKRSFLAGTAHFFPYHFRVSLKKILRRSKRALFEGPLDPQSMEKVVAHGSQGKGSLEIYEALDSQTLREIRGKAEPLFGNPQVSRGIPGKAGGLFISLSVGYSLALLATGRLTLAWGYRRTVAIGFLGVSLVFFGFQFLLFPNSQHN